MNETNPRVEKYFTRLSHEISILNSYTKTGSNKLRARLSYTLEQMVEEEKLETNDKIKEFRRLLQPIL